MKVRIIKDTHWHKKGEILEVGKYVDLDYWRVQQSPGDIIYKGCCEIIAKKPDKEYKEYKVINPFTILDIYKKRPILIKKFRTKAQKDFEDFFESLLKEEWLSYYNFEHIRKSEILMNNLPMLEEFGFIEEKIKDVELKPGMKLKSTYIEYKSFNYEVISAQENEMCILLREEMVLFNNSIKGSTLFLKSGSKLSDLNNSIKAWAFEVVNG